MLDKIFGVHRYGIVMEREIKYLVIDVDGTLTDSGIYYDEHGNEFKKFSTKDAAGFFAAHKVGIKILVITGRECMATSKRMEELKVDYLYQNVKNKTAFLKKIMFENQIKKEELGYIGDDVNDLEAMQLAGFVGCPADSSQEIISIADYVSRVNGGHGAVRDIIEHLLRLSNEWERTILNIYNSGI